jgi:hypothetical protein
LSEGSSPHDQPDQDNFVHRLALLSSHSMSFAIGIVNTTIVAGCRGNPRSLIHLRPTQVVGSLFPCSQACESSHCLGSANLGYGTDRGPEFQESISRDLFDAHRRKLHSMAHSINSADSRFRSCLCLFRGSPRHHERTSAEHLRDRTVSGAASRAVASLGRSPNETRLSPRILRRSGCCAPPVKLYSFQKFSSLSFSFP